jgi:hypothetical protein
MSARAPAILEAEDEYDARHDVLVAQRNLARRRAWRLERALRGLLAVAWANEDCPHSRTNRAIAAARQALEDESP